MNSEPAGRRQAGGWLGPRPVPESHRRTRDIARSRPAVEIYGWQIREKPLSIKIPIDIVERMQEDIQYGLGMRAPCDIMGLLIGRVLKEYSSTILIQDFVLTGYTSDSGLPGLWNDERLADMIQPWNRPGSPHYVVGFVRSNSRDWPEIEKQDFKCAKRLLNRTPNVFLLIRSGMSRGSTGRLFLRPSRWSGLDDEYGEFPLNADILRSQWDATLPKPEEPAIHFIPGNPLEGKESSEPPRRVPEPPHIEVIFERVEPDSVAPVHAAPADVPAAAAMTDLASGIVTELPLAELLAAELPKVGLWARLFRRKVEEAPSVEPAATVEAGVEASVEAKERLWARLFRRGEETPSVEPVAPAEAMQSEIVAEPPKENLWARFFRRGEESPSVEPVAPAEAMQSEIVAEPPKENLWARLFRRGEEAPSVEPVAPAEAMQSEIVAEPPKENLWARFFRPAAEEELPVEPVAETSGMEYAAEPIAAEPIEEEAWQSDVAQDAPKPSLWARLFRPAYEEEDEPSFEPVAAASDLDYAAEPVAAEPIAEPIEDEAWQADAEAPASEQYTLFGKTEFAEAAAEDGSRKPTPWFGDNPPPPPVPAWRSWLTVAATWLLAVGITMWCIEGRNPFVRTNAVAEAPVIVSNPIRLHVDSAGGLLDISWDRTSATALNHGGFLTIRDGALLKEVRLEPSEVQSGHIYYGARSEDLGIRLEIPQDDGVTASESIRIVGPPPAARKDSHK